MKKMNLICVFILGLAMTACGGKSFNLGLSGSNFTANTKTSSVPIDILWVVDDSQSMATSQANVVANVADFIDKFKETNFDFQIAVVTTGAYQSMAAFGGNSSHSRFKDRNAAQTSGVFVIKNDTPNLESVFQINVAQGIAGSGDERGLQSMEQALLNNNNLGEGFPRPGAFLSVIFMTDEEDFSHPGIDNIQFVGGVKNTIDDPRLNPISDYMTFLDNITNSTPDKRNYMVSTIGIFDQACLAQLATNWPGRRIAQRYGDLSDATGGVKASLCDNFSDILSGLTDTILQESTKFYLDREPVESTLQVQINGVSVDASNWTYDASEMSITFNAGYIPENGSSIQVLFQPMTAN